jgi:dUTP pyrophosphatase
VSDLVIELRVRRLRPSARLPARATADATGLDLYACLDRPLILNRSPQRVPCGIAVEAPYGVDLQVRPRSGLSARGVAVAFGTIDADYRGEILVTMWTVGECDIWRVRDGDRIAQLVVATAARASVIEVGTLSPSLRGEGGHGSTGR